MPSIIAELGHIVEKHLIGIGLLKSFDMGDDQKAFVEAKRAEFEAQAKQEDAFAEHSFPEGAQLCGKCSTAAAVLMDGCMTCLNCGYSKCG